MQGYNWDFSRNKMKQGCTKKKGLGRVQKRKQKGAQTKACMQTPTLPGATASQQFKRQQSCCQDTWCRGIRRSSKKRPRHTPCAKWKNLNQDYNFVGSKNTIMIPKESSFMSQALNPKPVFFEQGLQRTLP